MPRNPTPTSVLEAKGAFEHDPQRRRHEPECSGELGDPPTSFDAEESQAWMDVSRMAPIGVLKNADRLLVEVLARLIARNRRKDETGRLVDPLTASEQSLIISGLSQMGLTPVGRAKLASKTAPEKPPDDNFAKFRKQ
jgi:hypothetical protein